MVLAVKTGLFLFVLLQADKKIIHSLIQFIFLLRIRVLNFYDFIDLI